MTTCPNCGKAFEADAAKGLCPECLLKAGLAGETTASHADSAFAPPSLEELAKHFPQLEILSLLGRGGMGAVYKARQKNLDRIVALKILPPNIGGNTAFTERFRREARALAQLNHPSIVTLYEFGETGVYFFFLMEFVDGVNLRQLLATSRVEPREALAIVPQVCDALQYAHDQGIVHRDIKPANILLDRRGRVKVADFGLAKLVGANEALSSNTTVTVSGQTEAGEILGTPHYMAPEQIAHPADVDHRVDIYSLGVVIYQLLTGQLPAAKVEPPSRKVRIDVRLDEVVLRAMEKEPARRYQQVSEVRTQVETIAAVPDGANSKREWIKLAVVAAAVVQLVIVLLFIRANSSSVASTSTVAPPSQQESKQGKSQQEEVEREYLAAKLANVERKAAEERKAFEMAMDSMQKQGANASPEHIALQEPPPDAAIDVLALRLKQMEQILPLMEAREQAGLMDSGMIQDARDGIAIIRSRIAGDPREAARVRVIRAQRQYDTARLKFERGLMSSFELRVFQNHLETRQTELKVLERESSTQQR